MVHAVLTLLCACGDTAQNTAPHRRVGSILAQADPEPGHPSKHNVSPASTVLELLELLAQPHSATAAIGPHRLEYQATFGFGRTTAGDDATRPRPQVGKGVPARIRVEDSMVLEWVSAPEHPPQFRLEQHNDKHAGREIILIGDRVYSHLAHRGWFARDLDGDVHKLWLDDAQHAVGDLVSLMAPRLALSRAEDLKVEGRPALRFTLSLAGDPDDKLLSHPLVIANDPQTWRRRIVIGAISGSVTVDSATGIWLRATLDTRFTTRDDEGNTVDGFARLNGSLRFYDDDAPPPVLLPPAVAAPLPERIRPELEAKKLLEGLRGR